jgi:hypothetical protein
MAEGAYIVRTKGRRVKPRWRNLRTGRRGQGSKSCIGIDIRILVGVIAETVLNRTVSGIEERAAQLSQGRNLLFERFGRPDVAAAEADVFPTERSGVGE